MKKRIIKSVEDHGFRKPSELFEEKDDKHVPISGRLKESVRDRLARAVPKGESLSALVGKVLTDYADWLDRHEKPQK